MSENLARRRLLQRPQVVVLIGTSGAGKTTLRQRLLRDGLPAELVVSLDDLRRAAREDDLRRGRPARALQDYSAPAVRRAARRADALAAYRAGYLADATHLRRKERREHVLRASDTGLDAVAVLLGTATLEVLLSRNAVRPAEERVPDDVLVRQHHRRSLLSPDLLREEGFTTVLPAEPPLLTGRTAPGDRSSRPS